jgi:hypothetical protein
MAVIGTAKLDKSESNQNLIALVDVQAAKIARSESKQHFDQAKGSLCAAENMNHQTAVEASAQQ